MFMQECNNMDNGYIKVLNEKDTFMLTHFILMEWNNYVPVSLDDFG